MFLAAESVIVQIITNYLAPLRPFSTIAPLAAMAGTHVPRASKSISVIHSLSDRF
jgi:hypothetical protein